MADTPKSSLSLPRTTAEFFRTPSMEDDEAPLIGRSRDEVDDDDKPTLKFSFSFVRFIRVLQFPLCLATCILAGRPESAPGLAGLFVTIIVFLMIWNIFQTLNSLGGAGQKARYGCTLGNFEFSCGRVGGDPFHLRRRFSYMVNVVDLIFCALMVIPSVVCFKVHIYSYWTNDSEAVAGLCITIASLQLGIAVLGLFSFFRKVKICVYAAEYDEKAGIRIPENYHDGDLLRGGPSTTSIV